jgi:predicted enzyme related to lactoylglutathione lyase
VPNPVVHFEITGRDGERLQAFYRDLFGWSVDADNPMGYGMVDTGTGERGIPGGIGATQEPGRGWVTVYVEVEDLGAALAGAERLGGKRLAGPMDVPGGPKLALFADPEGHTIGLVAAAG